MVLGHEVAGTVAEISGGQSFSGGPLFRIGGVRGVRRSGCARAGAERQRGGVVVQVGNLPSGAVPVELAALVTREIEYRGAYRFIDEISDALDLLAGGLDVEPLLTHSFPIGDAAEASPIRAGTSSKQIAKIRKSFVRNVEYRREHENHYSTDK